MFAMLPTVLLYLLLKSQAPAVPAIVADPDYPLHVQLAQTGLSMSYGKTTAWGHGNILGSPAEGFDYTADCNQRFASRPEGDQYFRARWKKQGLKLEILIQPFGSERIVACELKVAMQDQPYELNPAGSRIAMMSMVRPAVPVTEPDAGFPLRVQLWIRSAGISSQSGAHAEGYGNILGATPTGFDFGHTCPIRLAIGRGGDTYQARWVEQGLTMEILVREVGTRQDNVCTLEVGMKDTPYSGPPAPVQRTAPPVRTPPMVLPGPTYNTDTPPNDR